MLISLLEHALSRYLALDPETLKRLSTLTGKSIKVELTDYPLAFYLFPNTEGIQIKKQYSGTVDAEIRGSLFTFFRIRIADEQTTTQLARQLKIKGDVHLAQTLSQIMQNIEIDWEEPISHYTGDIIAHQIGTAARGFKRWIRGSKQSLQKNVTEYLQEESHQLPPREEIEDFFTEVSQLQQALDRLEARLILVGKIKKS